MKLIYNKFEPDESIPVSEYIKNKKQIKYFTRETMSAMVSVGELLKGRTIDPFMPFCYCTAEFEYAEFDMGALDSCMDETQQFSSKNLVEHTYHQFSPVFQFKVMRNMTLCFVSIEYQLKGENAAVLGSVSGLLQSALYAATDGEILIGAGKIHKSGLTESGFALVRKEEIEHSPLLNSPIDAIHFFK